MKKIILLLVLLPFLSLAQKKDKVKGSKKVSLELREIGEFETLEEFNDRIWQIYWNARDFWCFALYRSSFVALAGTRLVGIPTLWETQLTGVARNHRGLGLAQVVKMKSILNSCEYGAETIKTGNDSGNLAMIAINRKMGFVHAGDRYSLELSL